LKGHQQLQAIAECLHQNVGLQTENTYFQQLIRQVDRTLESTDTLAEMSTLLEQFRQQTKNNRVLSALYSAVSYRWQLYGKDLLHCYDIPGLPPDNLHLESLFNRLRRRQRRISGRKSTKKLRDFGHYQVLFMAISQADLLEQIRCVPLAEYQKHRHRLAQAEAPRIFQHRLHRNPYKTLQHLLTRYVSRQAELSQCFQFPVELSCLCNV